MADRFLFCMNVVFGNEGGVSNHPADKGGLTNMGVTQVAYNNFRSRHGLPLQSVTLGTVDEFTQLYREDYWNTSKAGLLPVGLDLCVFDTAVNSGPARALMILQEALDFRNGDIDGRWGSKTAAAVANCDPLSLAADFCDEREEYFKEIVRANPSQKVFFNGWINRNEHIKQVIGLTND
jgi:lysozyme family protein